MLISRRMSPETTSSIKLFFGLNLTWWSLLKSLAETAIYRQFFILPCFKPTFQMVEAPHPIVRKNPLGHASEPAVVAVEHYVFGLSYLIQFFAYQRCGDVD